MGWFTAGALAFSAASTYMSVKGQKKEGEAAERAGKQQREAAESQAKLAEFNAAVADLQAKDAILRGDQEAQKFRIRTRSLVGEQRVGFAAGNVDVGFGSAVDVQADAAFLGELDALTVTTNAAREAWGYTIEGQDLRKRAEITRKEGAFAESAGRERKNAANWAAAGTAFNAGAGLLEKAYGFQRS